MEPSSHNGCDALFHRKVYESVIKKMVHVYYSL